jgi:hypothetical protein
MRVLPMLAFGLCFTTPALADEALGTYGDWGLYHYAYDNGAQACVLSQPTERHSTGQKGWVMATSLTDGGALVIVESDDWQTIVNDKNYGRVVITIDAAAWYGYAIGNTRNGVSITIAAADGAAFWLAFRYGREFGVQFPNDRLTVPLGGSNAGYWAMQKCYADTTARDPFEAAPAAPADRKVDPFSM